MMDEVLLSQSIIVPYSLVHLKHINIQESLRGIDIYLLTHRKMLKMLYSQEIYLKKYNATVPIN